MIAWKNINNNIFILIKLNFKIIEINIKFICTTLEYAITALKSLWIKQIKHVNKDPNKEIYIKKVAIFEKFLKNKIFKIPQPPNFNKTAAKKMDPIVGASTWALGNQICKIKIGNLTLNIKNNNKNIILPMK